MWLAMPPHGPKFTRKGEGMSSFLSSVKSLAQGAADKKDAVQFLFKHHQNGKQLSDKCLSYTSDHDMLDVVALSLLLSLYYYPEFRNLSIYQEKTTPMRSQIVTAGLATFSNLASKTLGLPPAYLPSSMSQSSLV